MLILFEIKESVYKQFIFPIREFDFLKAAIFLRYFPVYAFHSSHISFIQTNVLPICIQKIKNFDLRNGDSNLLVKIKNKK